MQLLTTFFLPYSVCFFIASHVTPPSPLSRSEGEGDATPRNRGEKFPEEK